MTQPLSLNPTMTEAMGMDLNGLFSSGENLVQVLVEGATDRISAMLNDQVFSEDEDIGGQQLVDLVELHFQVTTLSKIDNETVVTVFVNPTCEGKKKIVLTSKLSNDGNELIVTARAA